MQECAIDCLLKNEACENMSSLPAHICWETFSTLPKLKKSLTSRRKKRRRLYIFFAPVCAYVFGPRTFFFFLLLVLFLSQLCLWLRGKEDLSLSLSIFTLFMSDNLFSFLSAAAAAHIPFHALTSSHCFTFS